MSYNRFHDYDATDAEIDAECRLLGTILRKPKSFAGRLEEVAPDAFAVPFYRSVFCALLAAREVGAEADHDFVCGIVQRHPEVGNYGGAECLQDLAMTASPETFEADKNVLIGRLSRVHYEKLSAFFQRGDETLN